MKLATRRIGYGAIAGVVVGAAIAIAVVTVRAREATAVATPVEAQVGPTPPPGTIHLPTEAPVLGMIRVQALPRGPLPLSDVLSARIVYDEDRTARVTVGFNGRIARLIASPGDAVKSGSPLAEIDSPDFGLAAADLMKAQADEEHKRLTLTRSRDLLSGGVIPQKDVESAQADFAQARAETNRAALRVRNINPAGTKANGEHFLLASPMAGIVTERNANPAMEVSPALVLPLFVISDVTHLWALIDLPERLLGQVQNGERVTLESDAYPGQTFDATVVHIAQILDPLTRRIAVRAQVDNAALRLRPEMFVRATMLRESGSGVRVPNEALVNDGLYSYVYLQDGEHDFRRVRVDAVIKGARYSYVDGGLAGGERVVTSGALLLAAEHGAT